MEAGIRSLAGVKEVTVDFVSSRLRMEIDANHDKHSLMEQVKNIINRIESHVVLEEEKSSRSKSAAQHDHDHHSHDHHFDKTDVVKFVLGAALYATATVLHLNNTLELFIYLTAYVLVGGEVLLRSARNIAKGQVFDENFLMSIATIGAFAIGEYPEGVAVMLFYQIGEFFQDAAVNRSRRSIKALMDIRPDYANLKKGEQITRVTPDEVSIGDWIIVKPGEKVPLDGKVVEGISTVDTSALTGESLPRDIQVGDEILSGFVNKTGVLTIEVQKEFGESTVSRILDMVENASSKKSPTESFITKFARYYTPVVVLIAVGLAIIPPMIIEGAVFADWLYRALIFLVVSCPCALVVSIPLGYFGGIGGASRSGILIKGSNYLEALNNVDTVVFDKTGTLTKGIFLVTEVYPMNEWNKESLLEYAAYAESYSNHPIAVSIQKAFGKAIDQGRVSNYQEILGHGIKVQVDDKEVLAGNSKLMIAEGIVFEEQETTGTVIYIAVDKAFVGSIVIADELKSDSRETIAGLKELGVRKVAMLTGDLKRVAAKIGSELSLDEVHAELLPEQKVEKLEELEKLNTSKGKLIFVGDGINDAPVLARADIGVAMGGLGSDAAIEAADIVIMNDEPRKLITAIKIARRTRMIIWQNIAFAIGVKVIVLALGAGGLASMWEAVFADVGVAVAAILNAMRVMNVKDI